MSGITPEGGRRNTRDVCAIFRRWVEGLLRLSMVAERLEGLLKAWDLLEPEARAQELRILAAHLEAAAEWEERKALREEAKKDG